MGDFKCGRRVESWIGKSDNPTPDTYMERRGLIGQPLGCSYCGSLPGERFIEEAKNGTEIGPTDKGYKFYLSGLKREGDPSDLRVVSSSNSQSDISPMKHYSELDERERAAVDAHVTLWPDPKEDGYYSLQPWGEFVDAKFYTHHLDTQELCDEFWELVQEKKISWGYPGFPYVRLYLPFLPTKAKPDVKPE
jgi:hypothetical protein